MAAGTHSRSESESQPEPTTAPDISVCESCPGTVVFLESGNTDGWISSDVSVEVHR